MNMRQQWVDVAKGIAIIAVVLGHIIFQFSDSKAYPLSAILVWLWHVPAFFLIGGFFLKDEKLRMPVSFIIEKFRSLYLLILYIYIPILLLHNFFICIGFYDTGIEYYGKYVTEWGMKDLALNVLMAVGFAGREPLLGAMWFVYVLFMALCLLSVISWGVKKLVKEEKNYEYVRILVLISLATISCLLTKLYDFTIPRTNVTFAAVWLIYIGMMLVRQCHLKFDNPYLVGISCVIVYQAATVWGG